MGGDPGTTSDAGPPGSLLADIERVAADLAMLAGAEIIASLGRSLAIRYKDDVDSAMVRDPVSEVDHHVEQLVRTRLAEKFPDHDIIGEEMEDRTGTEHEFVWAIDPVDGTTNFINGFPLFAASIGVLHRGAPVAGAVWCSTSHALRAGVYHARLGGSLRFDGDDIAEHPKPQVRRHLIGMPHVRPDAGLPFDIRKTGSAAIECAFVAAGLLRAARFERPNLWDVAGGVALVRSANRTVRCLGPDGWSTLERFAPLGAANGSADLGKWRAAMAIGDAEAMAALCGSA